jgi:hypothetical protein
MIRAAPGRPIAIVVPFALLALPLVARADLAITFDAVDCEPEVRAIYVQGARARFDARHAGNDSSLLYDDVEQLAWGLDHGRRVAMPIEVDDDAIEFQQDVTRATGKRLDRELARADTATREAQAEACAASGGGDCAAAAMPGMPAGYDAEAMQAQLAQAQALMAQMDPKALERAGVDPAQLQQQLQQTHELMAAQQQRASSTVERNLGEQRVAGVACQRWERRRDGELLQSGCDAEPAALGLDARDQRGLEGAITRMMRWSEGFAELGARFGAAPPERHRALTLEQVCYAGGRETGRTTARISRAPIDAARFELPPGYRSMADAVREDMQGR